MGAAISGRLPSPGRAVRGPAGEGGSRAGPGGPWEARAARGSLTVFVSERQLERVFQQGLQHPVGGR